MAKTRIKGHAAQASKRNPQYLVESGKSKRAAHKREELQKN
jgi:hypothetical protein